MTDGTSEEHLSLHSVDVMTQAAVAVDHLTRRYKQKAAVTDVSLTVAQGETIGILGANGAGKTTLVETIAGLRRPTTGTVRVMGMDPIGRRSRVRQILGIQLQEAELHHDLTAIENLRLYRSFYPDGHDPRELLARLGLDESANTRAQRLSGGQLQRLSVAVALIGRPRIVILDELTTGLDPEGRREIWRTIENLQQQGVTIVLVSHSMDEVERLCHRLVMLERGRKVFEGTSADLQRTTATSNLEDAFVQMRDLAAQEHAS